MKIDRKLMHVKCGNYLLPLLILLVHFVFFFIYMFEEFHFIFYRLQFLNTIFKYLRDKHFFLLSFSPRHSSLRSTLINAILFFSFFAVYFHY